MASLRCISRVGAAQIPAHTHSLAYWRNAAQPCTAMEGLPGNGQCCCRPRLSAGSCQTLARARRMCQTLRGIPAAVSEHEALYGLDPMALAQLALKDASKVVEMESDWPRGHLLQVNALQRLGALCICCSGLTACHTLPPGTCLSRRAD